MKNYTILIQGPLDPTSLENLDTYKKYGQIVISHWNEDDKTLLDTYNIEGCRVVNRSINEACDHYTWGEGTFNYQCSSIMFGLEQVETPFVIRTRSDEFYGNLDPLIEKFEADKSKVVCGNIFFKRWEVIPHHIGDHLFVGLTETLLTAYKTIFDDPKALLGVYCPEVAAAAAIHFAVRGDVEFSAPEEFKRIFDVVDVNLLRPFIARWIHSGLIYHDIFPDPNCIKDMDEL